MQNLKPFFCFFGSKWRLAGSHYPEPLCDTVIEPFAGSAGYALRHFDKRVLLIERDPDIAAMWAYLIRAEPDDIRAIPLLGIDQHLDELSLSDGPRHLVGFNLGPSAVLRNTFTKSAKRLIRGETKDGAKRLENFWGEKRRERIARQVPYIKHWSLVGGDYRRAPNLEATWFVDPPYSGGIGAGSSYRYGRKDINFPALGDWCRARKGQTIVCEAQGADWLPFINFVQAKSLPCGRGKSPEAIWYQEKFAAGQPAEVG